MEAKVVWKDGMAFEAHLGGHNFMIDADEAVGGKNLGPKPKELTAISLAGCTGMDVVSILRKMKVDFKEFEVVTENIYAEEHPKKFDKIILKYIFTGDDLPVDKITKAITLSKDRYCGVMATLKPSVDIVPEILINGNKIDF